MDDIAVAVAQILKLGCKGKSQRESVGAAWLVDGAVVPDDVFIIGSIITDDVVGSSESGRSNLSV